MSTTIAKYLAAFVVFSIALVSSADAKPRKHSHRHYAIATETTACGPIRDDRYPCQDASSSYREGQGTRYRQKLALRSQNPEYATRKRLPRPMGDKLQQPSSPALENIARNGMVTVRTAFGFPITVHPAYASKFQRFFALLKDKGYRPPANITRCYSAGGHKPGSNHHIGAACDIQTGWNRGPSFVYHMGDIIRQAGLYDGCSFRDCGHVEAVRGLYNKKPNLYASLEKFKAYQSTLNYQP